MNITGIIISRKGSTRIPNKAWETIGSTTLIERKILQLKNVKSLTEIVVGSNDEGMEPLCKKYGVRFVKREEQFCDEVSTTPNDMIKNMLSFVSSDLVLWAHLTNPFINSTLYQHAIDTYLSNNNDSLFSATEIKDHFWFEQKPINHNPLAEVHVVARDLEPLYRQNGGIFIRKHSDMMNDGRFVGNKPYIYPLNEIQGWDLNYPWELDAARALEKYADDKF